MKSKSLFLLLFPFYLLGQDFTIERINIQDKNHGFSTFYTFTLDDNDVLWYSNYGSVIQDFRHYKINHQLTDLGDPFYLPADIIATRDQHIITLTEMGLFVLNQNTGKVHTINSKSSVKYDQLKLDKEGFIWRINHIEKQVEKYDLHHLLAIYSIKGEYFEERPYELHFSGNEVFLTNADGAFILDEDCRCFELQYTIPNHKEITQTYFVPQDAFPNTQGHFIFNGKQFNYVYIEQLNGYLSEFPGTSGKQTMDRSITINGHKIAYLSAFNKHFTAFYFNEKKTQLLSTDLFKVNEKIQKIQIDTENNIWVNDFNEVVLVNTINSLLNTIDVGTSALRGITIDSKKNVYTALIGEIAIVNADTKQQEFIKVKNGDLWPILLEKDSIIWVSDDTHFLTKINLNNRKSTNYSFEESLQFLDNRRMVITIVAYNEAQLILGGEFGLLLFDKTSGQFEDRFQDFNNKNIDVTDVIVQDSRLIIATFNHGLFWFDEHLQLIDNYLLDNPDNKPKRNDVHDIHLSNNLLYVGTSDGVYILDLNTKILEKKLNITDGLSDNRIASILETKEDFWFGTYNGLSRLNKSNGNISIYDEADGLLGDDFNRKSFYKYSDSLLAFGTTKGLVLINPYKIPRQERKIKPVLIETKFFNEENNTLENNYYNLDSIKEIKVPFDSNYISLSFGVYGDSSEQIVYKLQGIHTEWISANDKNQVIFSNLAPGKYTLLIKAQNNIESQENYLTYTLLVHRSIFFNPWFISITSSLLVVLALLFYIYSKVKKIKEKNLKYSLERLKDKAYKAQMNPHFTFNLLNNIKSKIALKKEEDVDSIFQTFARLLRSNLYMSDKNLISLEEELAYLSSYLELQQARHGHEMNISINCHLNDPSKVYIPPLLFQPLIENAVEHGLMPKKGKKILTISFQLNENEFTGIVEDNGIGIHESIKRKGVFETHKSYGKKILQERVNIYNSVYPTKMKLVIERGDENGTKVSIIIKNINLLK